MSQRDQMLKEILSDRELMDKYSLSEKEINELKCHPPYYKKLVEVLATIINENDNNRTPRQIYGTIKNIHKI